MMMKKLFTILFIVINTTCNAQFGEQQIITTEANGARAVYAIDIDGDGDIDVLSASFVDDKIAWYKNLDGQGNFSEQLIITTSVDSPKSVFAEDLDGDGDMDVITTSFNNGSPDVFWIENLDGQGTFDVEKIISDDANGAIAVHAADMDGDGDIDVLSASTDDNKIAWYENTDGLGSFGAQQIITTNALNARTVYTADIDGDGDMDVISASTTGDTVIWFKNDGLGNFGVEQIIANNINAVSSVFAEDIDGDGDFDVLSASGGDNKISWFENSNGLGEFGAEQIISTLTAGAHSVHAADLDNDGDMDVLSASAIDYRIAWYENINGLGDFGPQQVLANSLTVTQPRDVFAADLDGDGDIDVLSASQNDYKIAWYENLTILGFEDNNLKNFVLYPNPTSTILNINTNNIEIIKIEIYDVLGKKVWAKTGNTTQLDVSNLDSGLYLVNIQTEQGVVVKKVVKE